MVKKSIAFLWTAVLSTAILFFACNKGGGAGGIKLIVSVPAVTPEQIAQDVMDQESSSQAVANWRQNCVDKVVAWSGTVVEPDTIEQAAAARDYSYRDRTLVVVEVKGLRVQVPSDKAFTAGTGVVFTATLTGFNISGRKVFVHQDGLSINAVGR